MISNYRESLDKEYRKTKEQSLEMMLPWRTPAWLNDISTLDTSPSSPFPTLKLVAHDGVEVTFPALPLLAVSSSLAQLVNETLMNNSDR